MNFANTLLDNYLDDNDNDFGDTDIARNEYGTTKRRLRGRGERFGNLYEEDNRGSIGNRGLGRGKGRGRGVKH